MARTDVETTMDPTSLALASHGASASLLDAPLMIASTSARAWMLAAEASVAGSWILGIAAGGAIGALLHLWLTRQALDRARREADSRSDEARDRAEGRLEKARADVGRERARWEATF